MSRVKYYAAALLWPPVIALKIALILVGLLLVLIGVLWARHDYQRWPRILWLWGNDEDGLGPAWWFKRADNVPRWAAEWWWLAIRNPVNNSRFLFDDSGGYHERTNWAIDRPMEPNSMAIEGRQSAFRWRRRGWQSGYRRVWLKGDSKYSEIWLGWKIGSKVPGLGFALQVRLNRPYLHPIQ